MDILSIFIQIAVYGYVAYAILSRFKEPIKRILTVIKERKKKGDNEEMKIKYVIIHSNGLVSTFDYNHEQIPELQGIIFEVLNKIGEIADIKTQFIFQGIIMDLEWYFENRERALKERRKK